MILRICQHYLGFVRVLTIIYISIYSQKDNTLTIESVNNIISRPLKLSRPFRVNFINGIGLAIWLLI